MQILSTHRFPNLQFVNNLSPQFLASDRLWVGGVSAWPIPLCRKSQGAAQNSLTPQSEYIIPRCFSKCKSLFTQFPGFSIAFFCIKTCISTKTRAVACRKGLIGAARCGRRIFCPKKILRLRGALRTLDQNERSRAELGLGRLSLGKEAMS